jgi:hypothetical protein
MEPHMGTSYYRIKQVDFNGKFAYSTTQMVDFEAEKGIAIFPNPSRDYIHIVVNNEEPTSLSVLLLDLYGRTVIRINENVGAGIITKRINIDAIARGTYLLKVINGNQEYNQRQIILN